MKRLLFLVSLSVACGGSPIGPSDPDGLVLRDIRVSATGVSAGGAGPFSYNACGAFGKSPGVRGEVTVQSFSLAIRDQNGAEFLTWLKPGYPQQLGDGGRAGCFGGPLDPDPSRPRGDTFRLRVTYRGGAVEPTGPITLREPLSRGLATAAVD